MCLCDRTCPYPRKSTWSFLPPRKSSFWLTCKGRFKEVVFGFCSFSHPCWVRRAQTRCLVGFNVLSPSPCLAVAFGALIPLGATWSAGWCQRHMTVRRRANVLTGGARNRALRWDGEAICDVKGPRMIQTEEISWPQRNPRKRLCNHRLISWLPKLPRSVAFCVAASDGETTPIWGWVYQNQDCVYCLPMIMMIVHCCLCHIVFLLEVSSQSAGAAMCYESFQPRTAMVSGTMSDDARYKLSKLDLHVHVNVCIYIYIHIHAYIFNDMTYCGIM